MGATNCPETPRQKMITMMYLVYTAMLALNVSAEVLAGFKTVGAAMDKSNISVGQKINDFYDQFDQAHTNNPEKTQENFDKAQEVRRMSKELNAYIDSLSYGFICYVQNEIEVTQYSTESTTDTDGNVELKKIGTRKVKISEGKGEGYTAFDPSWQIDTVKKAIHDYGMELIVKKDDNHEGVNYFFGGSKNVEGEPPADCRIMVFKDKLLTYRTKLNEILGQDSVQLKHGIDVDKPVYTNDGKMTSWEKLNFNNTIQIACMVTLSRMRSEVLSAEYDAIKLLYNQISANDYKFDKVQTLSRPTSSYVVAGGKYETSIHIGAYDSKARFTVNVNGQTIESDEEGKAVYTTNCPTPGEKKIRGTITLHRDFGEAETYDFEDVYYVAEPMATASLTQMNVVYGGIDNPISIAVPGYDSRFVNPIVVQGNATIVKDPNGKAGDYIIKPRASQTGQTTKLVIRVEAKSDAQAPAREMGTFEYRIKPIPTPTLTLNKYKNMARVPKGDFDAARILVNLEGFDLKLDRPLRVTNYTFQLTNSGKPEIECTGNTFNAEVKSMLRKARKGDRVIITTSIKTPDGRSHELASTFRIQ